MIESPLRYKLLCYCLFCGSIAVRAQAPLESSLPILEIGASAERIPDEVKVVSSMRVVYNGPGATNVAGGPTLDYTGQIGIERRGSTSQIIFPKIGYAVELRESDGVTDRDAPLLGMPAEEDWVLHGPYSDKSLLRNAFTYTLAEAVMPYAPRTRFVELVLDGDYRGVYLLAERIKRDKHRVDISKLKPGDVAGDQLTGGYILKLDKPTGEDFRYASDWLNERVDLDYATARTRFFYEYPKPAELGAEQRDYIRGVTEGFERRLAGPDFADPALGYAPAIDVGSFIDFMLVNEVTRNVDGYRLSAYLFKDRDSEGGRLHMGPVWDFNLALGNADYCNGAFTGGWAYEFNRVCPDDEFQVPFWWQRLMEDPSFTDALAARYLALRQNGPLSPESLNARIDSLRDELADGPADRNFERWDIIGTPIWPNAYVESSHDDAVERVRSWLTRRMTWLDGAIADGTTPVATLPTAASREITLLPNPGHGPVRFTGEQSVVGIPETVVWLDVSGAVVLRQTVTDRRGYLDTPSRPGLYFWTLLSSERAIARGKWVRH